MVQCKKLDFTGLTIYCGVDVHKKNWRVNIQDEEFELEDFSQDAQPEVLYTHLKRRYPGAIYKIGYEAGFSGFSAARWLRSQGCDCVVLNAADIATTDKEKRQKNDRVDARKLCEHLQSRKMKAIHIPELHWEHGRSLVRSRDALVSNQTRCKNRIWQLLHFSGLSLGKQIDAGQYWSRRMIQQLNDLACGSAVLRQTLDLYIKDYQHTRSLLLDATKKVRELCEQLAYSKPIGWLRSIPGIGKIIAAIILFEIQDINRFGHFNSLASYAGLIPNTHDSGSSRQSKGITHRTNHMLRVALIEASWNVIRKDPALLMKYKQYSKRMDHNRAIIRIAKHVLARIRYVLKNETEYVMGVVA